MGTLNRLLFLLREGKMRDADGSEYIGTFVNDKRSGKGELI